ALGEVEREAVGRWAEALDLTMLHRLWQLALKGLADIRAAPRADHAAEMALLRMAHGATLPGPGDALPVPAPSARDARPGAPAAPPRPAPMPASFEALVGLVAEAREPDLARLLTDCVALQEFAPGRLELLPRAVLPRDFASRLSALLRRITGDAWQVQLAGPASPVPVADARTLREAEVQEAAALKAAALADPVVTALMDAFPEAEITRVEPAAARDRTTGRRQAG
ncbi:MAG: DNA polymerase III subunit gamma/tau, partial [Thermaurantiacus sp.]